MPFPPWLPSACCVRKSTNEIKEHFFLSENTSNSFEFNLESVYWRYTNLIMILLNLSSLLNLFQAFKPSYILPWILTFQKLPKLFQNVSQPILDTYSPDPS